MSQKKPVKVRLGRRIQDDPEWVESNAGGNLRHRVLRRQPARALCLDQHPKLLAEGQVLKHEVTPRAGFLLRQADGLSSLFFWFPSFLELGEAVSDPEPGNTGGDALSS